MDAQPLLQVYDLSSTRTLRGGDIHQFCTTSRVDLFSRFRFIRRPVRNCVSSASADVALVHVRQGVGVRQEDVGGGVKTTGRVHCRSVLETQCWRRPYLRGVIG